jgi:pyridoxamine 5'-phosphate oxidase
MTEVPRSTDSVFLRLKGATAEDPLTVLDRWLFEAKNQIGFPATAMSLATATPEGDPDVRIVLLQSLRAGGLLFFTNLSSAKGEQMLSNPKAAACLHWPAMGRQVRIRGTIDQVDDHCADQYFAGRSRSSQIGAHASPQSSVIRDREELVELVHDADARFAGRPVPRPSRWTGLALSPEEIEFWEDGADRLHDRMLFRRAPGSDDWSAARLAP